MILFYVILHIDNPPPAAFTLKCILKEIWSFLLSLNSLMHLKENKLPQYISFLLYQKPQSFPPVLHHYVKSLRYELDVIPVASNITRSIIQKIIITICKF